MPSQDVYTGLSPQELWAHFAALNRTPRPSGHEAAARAYVLQAAAAAGAQAQTDARGNVVVRIAASPGREGAPAVAIQAHLDMVCEKRPAVEFDFSRDPIQPRMDGDRIYATGTTLGADNGIGAAAGLAFLDTPGLEHGPLELLFTVEEETGLYGATALDPSLITARRLVNLDSEDPDELTIGCAGGAGSTLSLPARWEPSPEGWEAREIVVSGLQGGHSGVQIHEPLANAIKLLIRALKYVRNAGVEFRVAAISGGNAHNAIPRDARALLVFPAEALPVLTAATAEIGSRLHDEWRQDEKHLAVQLEYAAVPERTLADADPLIQLLEDLPHGVLTMSEVFPGKVETSSNLAKVVTGPDAVEIATSSRSFVAEELDKVQREIALLAEAAGAEVDAREGYPAWEPQPNSELLRVTRRVYEAVLGKKADVQVIHAGLECGIIVSKLPGMEAISFGPLIRGAHTPEEWVSVSSVSHTWRLLTALLAALSEDGS